jgi:hypothetical protein
MASNGILNASTVAFRVFAGVNDSSSQHIYEIRPRKDRRGIDLIGERLPLGVLWFEGPDAIEDAVNYARSFSHPHPAIVRVLDESGTLAVTLESADDFSRAVNISASPPRPCLMSSSKSIARSKNRKRPLRAKKGKSKRSLRASRKEGAHLKPYTVRYDAVNAMLLNEFLKEHRKNEKQEATIAELRQEIAVLAAGLQKVSAQLEASKPAPQTVFNNQ